MGNVRFFNNAVLFDTNKVAMHEDCCCVDAVTCIPCDGGGPSQFQVVIAGIADEDCDQCNNYNGTFTLDHFDSSSTLCRWRYETSDHCTNCNRLELGVNTYAASTNRIYVSWYKQGFLAYGSWEKLSLSDPYDCLGVSSLSIPFLSENYTQCDFSLPATCVVTAL